MVAEDTAPIGAVVGTVDPPQVAARTKQDVRFTVPSGEGWAVFVNPSPQRGPLILAVDVPLDVEGKLPISISVGPNGDASVLVPGRPGWFGN